jgi:Polysaccharide lyase
MKTHVRRVTGIVIVFAVGLFVLFWFWHDEGLPPFPDALVAKSAQVDGTTFKLLNDGNVYRVDARSGRWHFHDTVFFPKEMQAAYVVEAGKTFRVSDEDGKRYATVTELVAGFEDVPTGVAGIRRLIGAEHGWSSLTLQSPQTPDVPDYVDLRNKILKGETDFQDALVAPDTEHAFRGKSALKCSVPAPSGGMICSKASISSPLVYFRKGDHFWFRGHFFAAGARPSGIMDLECEFIKMHSGIRLFIDESGRLLVELKALDKPKYQQDAKTSIPFPMDQWVEVTAHFSLSDKPDGIIQVWQDSKLIIDTQGVTLPFAAAIYNSLEVGITAHSYGTQSATLWIDDIKTSKQAFR